MAVSMLTAMTRHGGADPKPPHQDHRYRLACPRLPSQAAASPRCLPKLRVPSCQLSTDQRAPFPTALDCKVHVIRAVSGLTSVSAQNRGVPVASSARMQPQLHMSIGREYSSAPSSSSGARYSRVWTCRRNTTAAESPDQARSSGREARSSPVWVNPCRRPPPSKQAGMVHTQGDGSSHLAGVRAGSTRVGGPPQAPVTNLDGAAVRWAGSSAALRAVVCGGRQAARRPHCPGIATWRLLHYITCGQEV